MPMADGYIVPYNLTTVSQEFNGGMSTEELTVSLQHYVFSLGVQNISQDCTAKIYINKYTNDSVLVPPGSYKEIAVTTDWYRLEFIGDPVDSSDIAIVDRVETEDPDLLMTPLFPNLYQSKDFTATRSGTNVTITNTELTTSTFFTITTLSSGSGTLTYSYIDADDNEATGQTISAVQGTTVQINNTLKSFTLETNGSVKISVSGPIYNAINAGGYTYTPWSTSDGSTSVLGADSVVKVDYYLNGVRTTKTGTSNFYATFADDIFSTINSYYPTGYEPAENPQYDPAQFADIIVKTRTFFDSIKATSIHDQYIGGWALMTSYNKDLALYEFTLDGASDATKSIELPFTALGFTLQRVTGSNVDVTYLDKDGNDTTVTLSSSNPLIISDQVKVITVDDAYKVKVTFSGNLLKLIDFAPIINIVYPLGFDETSGKPLTEYQSYTNALTAFHSQLAANNFTGRVVYLKSVPFGLKEPSDVWNADYIIPEYMPPAFKLVFPDIQNEVYNWYVRSNMESDLLKVIAWENRDVFYYTVPPTPEPTNLLDVINNDDVDIILGETVTGANSTARSAFKRNVIKKFLLKEYNGAYSTGGINFFRFGFTV